MTDRISAKVRQSKKYDKFRPFAGNRGHEPKDIRKLMASLEKHGWWDSMPMTVRQNGSADTFDIKDGHTRYFAAQELGIPVKYVVLNGEFNDEDIFLANETQKSWTSKDYCKSWAHLGKKDYIQLLKFMDTYKTGVSISISLLSKHYVCARGDIRSGQFKVVDLTWAIESLNYLIRMNSAIPFNVKKQKFVAAFISARQVEDFNPERFITQVTNYSEQVKDYHNASDIAQMFEDVYNYNRARKNQMPLAFSMQQVQKGE